MEARDLTIDAWRGFACLLVFFFHLAAHIQLGFDQAMIGPIIGLIASKGDLGVIWFFSISGYCIANSVLKGRVTPARFLQRRVERVFPAYIIALSIFIIVDQRKFSAVDLGTNILLLVPLRGYLLDGRLDLIMPHAWSLCYEIQYYLAIGVMLLLPGRMISKVVAITILSAISSIYSSTHGFMLGQALFIDGFWLSFSSGFIACYARRNFSRGRSLSLMCGLLILYLSLGLSLHSDHFLWASLSTIPPLTLYFEIRTSWVVTYMAKVGTFSYSLYLIHPLLTEHDGVYLLNSVPEFLFFLSFATAITLLLGYAFYFTIEQPAFSPLSQRRLFGQRAL